MTVLGTSGLTYDDLLLRNHLIGCVNAAQLEPDPFCHVYMEGIFPSDLYDVVLRNLPPASLYSPLNLRKWVRSDGTSTRDQYYLTAENLARLPPEGAKLWATFVNAITDATFKRAIFSKLAPDLAQRFGVSDQAVPDIECGHELMLVRDTEDYVIKPHPDGLNKLVTMQFYLPTDNSQLELGTSLFRRHRGIFGSTFEEVKRFPFRPNSAYAFVVSDSRARASWHGRERLSGFTGVRNTLMVLFQKVAPRAYKLDEKAMAKVAA
jgi:hypothetical protein